MVLWGGGCSGVLQSIRDPGWAVGGDTVGRGHLRAQCLLNKEHFKINANMHVPELELMLFRDSAKQMKRLLQNNYLEKMLQKDRERTMCFSMVCLQCITAGLWRAVL